MTTLYLDSSCVLRILFGERGARAPLGKNVVAVSSRLAEVECFRALDRARLTGALNDAETAKKTRELEGILSRAHLVPLSDDVVSLARATFPVSVRALDALHVATAQWLATETGPLQFWTHDGRQAIAATTRGLDVRGI
jgi:hypothetical protein